MYKNDGEHSFRTIREFLEDTSPANGSQEKLASIKETANGDKNNDKIAGKTLSYEVADELEENGMDALKLIAQIASGGNKRLDTLLKSVQQQAFLSLYYAHKIRGATFLGVPKEMKKLAAQNEMRQAYGWWMYYVNAMESMYEAEDFRTYEVKNLGWHFWDKSVLAEYHDLGGSGTPPLPQLPASSLAPIIISSTNANYTLGSTFTYHIMATNYPTMFAAADLPSTLTINPTTGVVSGSIASVGQTTFTVTATNSSGVGSQVVKVTAKEPRANASPSISNLPDFTVEENKLLGPISLTVKDNETPAGSLILTATSSNISLVPISNIVFTGSGANRMITITPLPNKNGKTTITVTVSDGSLSQSTRSSVTVKTIK